MAESQERQFIGAYADRATAEALREIAAKDFDHNQSMALRYAVREAAARRGVLVETVGAQPTQEGGGHV